MKRFVHHGIVTAALLLSLAAPGVWASTIDYLNLSADSGNINFQGGTVGYTSTGGATVNVTPATTYSVPSGAGLTNATVSDANATYDSDINTDLTVSASATGNLATGSVGVSAMPEGVAINPQNDAFTSNEAIASAQLDDLLTFSVAGASSNTVTDIGVTFTVDGDVTPGTQDAGGGVLSNYGLTFGDGGIRYVYDTGDPSNPNSIPVDDGWVSSTITSETPDSFIFSGVYALTGATDQLSIQMLLGLTCTGDASCDVSHTGAVSFDLPSDVTFTSASGVFLTEPMTTATPEPSYAAVAGIGLLGLIVFARRRQNRSA
jgi:hypothetical protein